ncbi:ABC transporter substrate-binding protein [Acidisoma silvae]|uniref:ABC transporter substrate-binding protein n=1 Tax=Acidisoma silvae TaxID=2802396 RepID=A0A964E0U5_9PROT|nr:ABC transporter substrate-binding protein [Acidisoma silvae]MCB8877532.1 ABC transporter substrate-binding protein [Acidisoma silvae]
MTNIKAFSARPFTRRAALTATGLALGTAALPGSIKRARAADRTQITFASANFYGKETIGQIADIYNQSQSKVQVTYVQLPPPSSSTEVHQALVQQLARRNGTPDVFTQDVIWIAEFASAGWALPLDSYFGASVQKDYFPGLIQACTFRGKLTALPWHVDSGMLYYRTDLLQKAGAQVPTTWQELTETAQKIQQAGGAKFGYLWQGKQAEVLVCDLVEVVGSAGGGILAPDGKTVLIAEAPAVEAVQFMHDTIAKSKISPQDVLSWDEEPSRGPFTAGDSVFLRNWSYVYKIAEDQTASSIAGKVGVAPLPHFPGKQSAACLGGYQYGVNAHTQNREAAIDFITWMSSPDTQLRIATGLGLAPTRPAVFDQPELIAKQPFMHTLKDVFVGATPRPVTPLYPQVTLALQSAVSRALVNGNVQAELNRAKDKIAAIVG